MTRRCWKGDTQLQPTSIIMVLGKRSYGISSSIELCMIQMIERVYSRFPPRFPKITVPIRIHTVHIPIEANVSNNN